MLIFFILAAFCVWIAYRINFKVHYNWNWGVMPQYLYRFDAEEGRWVAGLIVQGVFVTLRLGIYSIVVAMVIGTVMGLFRTSRSPFRRMVGWSYVEIIRNIPILVWIFIFYFFISDQFIPIIDLAGSKSSFTRDLVSFLFISPARFPAFLSGLMALGIYEGAYITEIVRAGIQSIDRGQWEAASALGFSRYEQLRHIIFPQAAKNVLPPLAGQFISTIKDSSIVSVISIQELTFQGMELMSATFLTFEVWITVMLLYLVICLVCSLAAERLEIHMKRGVV
ncbi:MAG: amino acid ABC transporter permease [Deltaproteobacteria bacterium]|jgi:polar amino acid transport system permease protein|nr:amino acid ABC transporter permease [Deltaproteobacteria bacterium]MBW1968590.1 amino acid ABC transporter permease [Deltaproteobacteria bacterium]MBW2196951.1 amino acid ABC transporter permease [Deltaproteobacteria bacterium]